MTEWRTIPGFTRYQASDDGQVRSLGYGGRRSRVLRSHPNPVTGYMQVAVYDDAQARQCTQRVNILVLTAFVGPRPDGLVCRHFNDIPHDNRLENLAWGTPSRNIRDLVDNGLHHQANKTHCPRGHAYDYISPTGKGGRACRTCHKNLSAARIASRLQCKHGHPYPAEMQARFLAHGTRRWCQTCINNRKPRYDRRISA